VKWIPGVGVVASAIAGDGLAVTTGDGTSAPTTLDTCWRVSSGGGCGTCRTAALMLPLPCKATTNLTTVGPESATGLGAEPSASAALGAVTAARDGVSVLPDADATPTWTVAVRAGVGVLPTANAAAGVAIWPDVVVGVGADASASAADEPTTAVRVGVGLEPAASAAG
jgi:hypothetical protein